MPPTRLEFFKDEWKISTNGEALFRAAKEGFFPIIKGADEEKVDHRALLKDMGFTIGMNRDEIAFILTSRLGEDDIFHEATSKLADRKIEGLENVEVFPGVKRPDLDKIKIRENAIKKSRLILTSLLNFCEYEMLPEYAEKYHQKKPTSRIKRALQFLFGSRY